ncbi:ribosomal protein S6 [Thozetella sp. PMI_491]|nr:ribosomal protein S6 [Thozetella sp. PMI_491]
MLYEVIGIVRPGNVAEVKEIVLAAGQLVLRQGGVIRDIANWGTFLLPKPITRHEMRHTRGHYFVMRFDSGVRTQEEVHSTLRLDPRIIRASSVRLGDNKLSALSKLSKVQWSTINQ